MENRNETKRNEKKIRGKKTRGEKTRIKKKGKEKRKRNIQWKAMNLKEVQVLLEGGEIVLRVFSNIDRPQAEEVQDDVYVLRIAVYKIPMLLLLFFLLFLTSAINLSLFLSFSFFVLFEGRGSIRSIFARRPSTRQHDVKEVALLTQQRRRSSRKPLATFKVNISINKKKPKIKIK